MSVNQPSRQKPVFKAIMRVLASTTGIFKNDKNILAFFKRKVDQEREVNDGDGSEVKLKTVSISRMPLEVGH